MKCLDTKYFAKVSTKAGKFHSDVMLAKIQTHAVFNWDNSIMFEDLWFV